MHFKKTLVWVRIRIHRKLAPDPDLTLKEEKKNLRVLVIKRRPGSGSGLDPDSPKFGSGLIIPDLQNIDLH